MSVPPAIDPVEEEMKSVVSSEQASDTVYDAELRIKTECTEDDPLTDVSVPSAIDPDREAMKSVVSSEQASDTVYDTELRIKTEHTEDVPLTEMSDPIEEAMKSVMSSEQASDTVDDAGLRIKTERTEDDSLTDNISAPPAIDPDEEAMKSVVSSEKASDTIDDAGLRIKTERTEDDPLTEGSLEDDSPTERSLEDDPLTSNTAQCITENNSDQCILIDLTDDCDVTDTKSCEIPLTPKTMKMEPPGNRNCLSSLQLEIRTKIMNHLCKLFDLDTTLSLEENREIMKKRRKQFHEAEIENSSKSQCKVILISQMPPYFTDLHVRTLIELFSDFDVSSEFYMIDVIESTSPSSRECLLRFMKRKDCLVVLNDLQGININGNPILVKLDSDFKETRSKYKTNSNIKKRHAEMAIRFQQYKKHKRKRLASTNTDRNCGVDIKKEPTEEAIEKIDISSDEDDARQTEIVKDQSTDIKKEPTEEATEKISEDDAMQTEMVEDQSTDIKKEPTEEATDNISENDAMQTDMVEDQSTDIKKESTEEATEKISEDDAMQTEMVKDQSISANEINMISGEESGIDESINENDDENVVVLVKNLRQKKIDVLQRLIKQKAGIHMNNYLYRNLYEAGELSDNYLLKFFKPEDAKNTSEKINGIEVCGHVLEAKLQKGSTFMETSFKKPSNRKKGNLFFITDHQFKKRKIVKPIIKNINLAVAYLPPEVGVSDTYGLDAEFLKNLGISPPLYSNICVKNLHPEVDEAKLLEVFSLAGEVKKIDLCMGTKGPKALIDFDHPIEAVQAISMFNGHKLYEKEMQVHMNTLQEDQLLPLGLSSVGPGLGQDGLPLRGVRTSVEIKKITEKLFDIGRYPEVSICDNDKTNNLEASNADSWNTNVSTDTTEVSQSTNANQFCDVTEALQALGTALISDGLVPPDTDCRNIQGIMSALKNKKKKKKKSAASDTMPKPNENGNFTLQHDFSRPPPTPRGPNPNMVGPRGSNPNMAKSWGPNQNITGSTGSTFENQNMLPSQPQNNLDVPNFTTNQGHALNQNQAMNQLMNVMSSNAMMPNMIQPNMLQAMMQVDMAQNIMQSNMTNVRDFGMGFVPNMNQHAPVPTQPMIEQPAIKYDKQSRWGVLPQNPASVTLAPMVAAPMAMNMPQNPASITLASMAAAPMAMTMPQNPASVTLASMATAPPMAMNMPQNPASVTLAPMAAAPPMAMNMPQNKSQSSETAEKESSHNDKETGSGAKKGDTLMFKYLPSSVTADALARKMREAGELMLCERTDKGRAVVRFKSAADAQRCHRLFHNSKVDGQIIKVKIV